MQSFERSDRVNTVGYVIDVVSSAEGDVYESNTEARSGERPWVGVHFECCGAYTRIYREADIPQYEGRCPRCGRPITISVGPQGISARVLRARLVSKG